MDFTSLTVEVLKGLNNITGSYGLAIIALTIIVRGCLWPLGVSQQRSMRAMQVLQPKMKLIQERYKNDPQTMQKKMMEFYKEHKFNPMSGCLPLLIQMPIFIMLYAALISPQFMQESGNSNFLFINRLDTTLRGNAGTSYDKIFS
ncbi:MAG: YidC/Oxa1 family membrane protein insertase, partial [Candidatus Gastranaerophilales bacterium]|nr:YidC/Oxa1 family membrane protein insertase [Candidatus Gastranaerophilales bacterium]